MQYALSYDISNTTKSSTAKFNSLAAKYAGNILNLLVQGYLLKMSNYAYCFLTAMGAYLLLSMLIAKYMPEHLDYNYSPRKSIFKLYVESIGLLYTQPEGGGSLLNSW